MAEIDQVHVRLGLSQMNQLYYAERVDYYGAKLKRQSSPNQRLLFWSNRTGQEVRKHRNQS